MNSVVVGSDSSSPVTGVQADLLAAAYNAAEAGLRGARVRATTCIAFNADTAVVSC